MQSLSCPVWGGRSAPARSPRSSSRERSRRACPAARRRERGQVLLEFLSGLARSGGGVGEPDGFALPVEFAAVDHHLADARQVLQLEPGCQNNEQAGNLADELEAVFSAADRVGYEGYAVDYYETEERNHGRHEIRRYWSLASEDLLVNTGLWGNLNMIGMMESQRTVDGETSIEYRYYIASIENSATEFARAVRGHWGIENGLHWVLDVALREDDCRVRKGNAPENLALLRHIAVNAVKQEKTKKLGVKNKRLKAGWDETYLAKIMCGV